MSDNEHVKAITAAASNLAMGNIWFTEDDEATIARHADAMAKELADARRERDVALQGLGDFETIDQENAHLRHELDDAEARAKTQLSRAERLAQAIMGLCEGDANDIEFDLDLYPLDLYDQTGGTFVAHTSLDDTAIDPFDTPITPLQREAVIAWLRILIPDPEYGDTEGER